MRERDLPAGAFSDVVAIPTSPAATFEEAPAPMLDRGGSRPGVAARSQGRDAPHRRRAFRGRLPLALLSACLLLCAALPASALAEATPAPEPAQGPPGLPDGRVYEEVSPLNSAAAASYSGTEVTQLPFVVAGANGNEVAFFKTGPMGETPTGYDFWSIAHRTPSGWQTRGAMPRAPGQQGAARTEANENLGFSSEMTSTIFSSYDVFKPEYPPSVVAPHLYRYREDGEVQWIGKPAVAHPFEGPKPASTENARVAGTSPSMSTVFFSYNGVLTPADEEPNPRLGGISRAQELEAELEAGSAAEDLGFYEWHEGKLENAGVLPDGQIDPLGAAPAATPILGDPDLGAEQDDNQVSENGTKAFFVSPDPREGSGRRPPQLYVRETAPDGSHRSVLVSRDLMLPDEGGEPALAPDGVVGGTGAKGNGQQGNFNAETYAYAYASPDGSHVFFQSADPLTANAPDQTETAKQYVFDTETETLTYLPGVADVAFSFGSPSTAHILVSSPSGSSFLFVRESGGTNELEAWHEGTIDEIAPIESGGGEITYARASTSGSAFVFQTQSPFANMGFDNAGGYQQIYRYEVDGDRLSCISCAGDGTAPAGNARLNNDDVSGIGETHSYVTGDRSISEEGNRIFFETPTALVAQDTNGVSDVYEWENGTVYLISSGASSSPSYVGDNSPSGNDEFFVTAEGLVPSDKNEGYDLYDARVPRPGDVVPTSAVPCEGAVCQGPASTPNLLAAPASTSFNGLGNVAPPPPRGTTKHTKKLTRRQGLDRALRACRKADRSKRARRRCEARARARYGGKAKHKRAGKKRGAGKTARNHNGRGK